MRVLEVARSDDEIEVFPIRFRKEPTDLERSLAKPSICRTDVRKSCEMENTNHFYFQTNVK
jgi:hypothetical protein